MGITSDDSLINLVNIGSDGGIDSADVEAEDLDSKSEVPTPDKQDTESVDSDSCRIRGQSEEESSDWGNEVTESVDSLGFVRAIFDQICVVFPSAFKHVSGTFSGVLYPHVTMSPSFLEKTSGEELLLAFDDVARVAFGTPFLHYESSASKSSFLMLFQRLVSSGDTEVPLYVLLLSRFQMAIFEKFEKHQKCLSETESVFVDVALLDSNEGKELSSYESESSTIVQKEDEDFQGGSQLISLMGDVASHAHAMDDLAVTIDTNTLKEFMAPFVSICFTEGNSFSADRLEHLVLTPLSWLLHARQKNGAVDFEAWDIALQSALTRMRHHGSSAKALPIELKEATSAPEDVVQENVPTETSTVSEAGASAGDDVTTSTVGDHKRKKKQRRRRVSSLLVSHENMMFAVVLTFHFSLQKRKSSNADTMASATTEPSVSIPVVEVEHEERDVEENPIPAMIETSKDVVEALEVEADISNDVAEALELEAETSNDVTEASVEEAETSIEEIQALEVDIETSTEEIEAPEVDIETSIEEVEAPEVYIETSTEEVTALEVDIETSSEEVTAPEVDSVTLTEEVETLKEEVEVPKVDVETSREQVENSNEEVEASKEEAQASKEQVETNAEEGIGTQISRDTDVTKAEATPSSISVVERLQVNKSKLAPKGDITLSRVDGVIVVATPLSQPSTNSKVESSVKGESAEGNNVKADTGDVWETVEVRARGGRKKPGERTNQSGSRKAYLASHSAMSLADSKRGKSTRTPASRKKVASRKMARDILASVLDKVDDTVREKKQNPPQSQSAVVNPWNKRAQFIKPVPALAGDSLKGRKEKRDFIFRKQAGAPSKPITTRSYSGNEDKTRLSVPAKSSPSKNSPHNLSKGKVLSSADQNTAPTYQETISATSAGSNDATGLKRGVPSPVSNADTEDSDEGPQKSLPTHLSPKSVNSANSSVASSLEVPHTRRHHSNSTGDVNDVGYHLLDVCDRLTRDMSLFMSRRNLALNTRRRERGALLSVLQDTVAGIWPGKCHVEMYGSCATQLDLPSSDLDVVVRGMSHSLDVMMSAPPTPQGTVRSMSISSESVNMSQAMEDQGFGDEVLQHGHNMPPVFMSMHMNGERVKRLAATLEQQPWVVQVNAIPTASVPVVKVLADPSKLPGVSLTIQHQKLAAQAAVASGHSQVPAPSEDSSAGGNPTSRPQPWRGADVMNGLLSLDITFEGPEHGGIGSTEFSANAVAEICQATGLMPDATPFVQVLMVLKELLAQRKLNEPFSGGLSSYAVLLLVVALVRERAVIREEIERVERQRKAVAAGDVSAFSGTPSPLVSESKKSSQNGSSSQVKKDNNGKSMKGAGNKAKKGYTVPKTAEEPVRRATSGVPKVSSWATIAKKPSTVEDSKESVNDSTPKTSRKISHKPSFADAVARSNPVAAKPNATIHKKRVVPAPPARTTVRDATDAGKKKKGADSTPKESPESRPAQSDKDATKEQTNVGTEPSLGSSPSFCPQGYNDVIEVLCSGEVTAGKLLMHFLLYYGQHFDAHNTAIDVSGKHDRSFMGQYYSPYSHFSSYIPRHAPGTIDPITGMFSVDPIVIYDPLEGAESNNVARRCFAWNSIRWIFAQSYATLSSAVERSTTPPTSPGGAGKTNSTSANTGSGGREVDASEAAHDSDGACDLIDPSSPLLRCLLSI
jgi:hypothetical protein